MRIFFTLLVNIIDIIMMFKDFASIRLNVQNTKYTFYSLYIVHRFYHFKLETF